MADSAFQTMYRKEVIMGFEKKMSLARRLVTTEAQYTGNECVFLVADSGGATAVTRGINGDIPSRPDNLNQYTCVLREWHDKPKATSFNIFASQGNRREIMQNTSMAVMNRRIDDDIHDELTLGTNTWGPAALATLQLVLKSKAKLAQNSVNSFNNGNGIAALITPAFEAKISEEETFTSRDFISSPKFEGVGKDLAFAWKGIDFVVDEGLPGAGTGAAECFMFHKASIGHAANTETLKTVCGYDEEDDYSFCRMSMFMGSRLLQNSGIIKMIHDDATVLN